MATQKFMGSNQLIDRLAAQVGSKGTAIAILIKRGHIKADGKNKFCKNNKVILFNFVEKNGKNKYIFSFINTNTKR
jgi:hypothetical protein